MSNYTAEAVADIKTRLQRAAASAQEHGFDALLVSPGTDLRYLTGYEAKPLERLTCLVVPVGADPFIVVPLLEKAAALASPIADLGLDVVTWTETENPYAITAARIGGGARHLAFDDHMWAEKVFAFAESMPRVRQSAAGGVLQSLRMRKTAAEIEGLRRAGAAIDSVHANMGQWLRPGRTEAEVARDITDAIIASGHARMDFVIVASGPNGASPHHEASARVINPGEPVVVDIGGTMPDGYCSDSTRMYCVGDAPELFTRYYKDLQAAQQAATDAVKIGATCESIDAAARNVLIETGWGEYFIHRVGHGIGLDTHEHPYMVQGNSTALEAGMAFSIEPGVYIPGEHGARIEDIVVCSADGADVLNLQTRDLVVL